MRFHHAVLLAALAIDPVCAEHIKVSDERGIVDSTLSAVGGVDCGGGGSGGACGATTLDNGSDRGGSRDRGERARRLVANGQSEDDARWGQSTLSTAVRGGGIAGTTRTTMTRKRTSVSSPTAAAAAAAATTAIARCSTAGGVATAMGGTGDDDGDVEAPAVRVTDW
jgi:hypothetical protein